MDTTTYLLAASNNEFGINLFQGIFTENSQENLFISPFSISAALAMTQLGACGTTALAIATALCWPKEKEEKMHEQFHGYLTKLQTDSGSVDLSMANRMYLQTDAKILDDFKNKTESIYSAEPSLADFAHKSETERLRINAWVAEKTGGKIKDLIAAGVVDKLTRMVLVNAIYFKGGWDEQFDERKTEFQSFKLAPGKTNSVPMMHTKKKFVVSQNGDLKCTAVEIPYKNKDLSMVVILPLDDFGLQDLIKTLKKDTLDRLMNDLRSEGNLQEVILSLPKFEVTSSHSLKETLSALGMSDAFSADKADFSGITGNQDLFISDAIHKAFIKVNEEGTEAAAASAGLMRWRHAPMPEVPFTVHVDHPFLYLIKDNRANDLILFIGAVVDPLTK